VGRGNFPGLETYILRLVLLNMKTGYTIAHEVNLEKSKEENYWIAYLPHRLYHRIEAHFGKGPFTTEFTLSHGPYMLHGYIKSEKEVNLPIVFKEKD